MPCEDQELKQPTSDRHVENIHIVGQGRRVRAKECLPKSYVKANEGTVRVQGDSGRFRGDVIIELLVIQRAKCLNQREGSDEYEQIVPSGFVQATPSKTE